MATIHEIAPDVFRISFHAAQFDLGFNHFLVRDEQPLLFHAGLRGMFPDLRDAVASLIDLPRLRWIGYSHFEADECGALNLWLAACPQARPFATMIQAGLSLADFADREPQVIETGEALITGRRRFTLHATPHLPHGWDATVLFEETDRTLFCSDLLIQFGQVEPRTESDILGRVRQGLRNLSSTPFAYSTPYTAQTRGILQRLAKLAPKTLAAMHGSAFIGDGARVLEGLDGVLRGELGG